MERGKVLITDGVHPVMFEGLKNLGFKCDYMPKIPLEDVHRIIHQYQGIVINSKIIAHKELLDRTKDMIFIARLGSGMEIIDQAYAHQKGIHIINAPEGNRNAVAEHALGMLLALANKLHITDREVKNKDWNREKSRGFELYGKTLGIIGFGHTGRTFAKKIAGLGMTILAYDKYLNNFSSLDFVKETSLEDIQSSADIISFHLPLNEHTYHLCNAEFIDQCKSGVILVNTSRGAIINTNDLVSALESGKIAGACLDVFENEKPATFSAEEHQLYDQLYQFDNVILSPHVAGWTTESKYKLSKVILDKLERVL